MELDKTAGYIELHNRAEFTRLGITASPVLRDGNYAALNGRLTFYSYGTAHILKKVWMEGDTRGALLQPTKTEREMARRTTQVKAVAKITSR